MIRTSGNALNKVDRNDARYKALLSIHERLAKKDPTIWGPDAQAEAAIRLNWIDLPESSRDLLPALDALYAKHRDKKTIILCGMGGSSLGPEVIAASFKKSIFILDSTTQTMSSMHLIPIYPAHSLLSALNQVQQLKPLHSVHYFTINLLKQDSYPRTIWS